MTVAENDTAAYTLVLNTEPSADVIVDVTSSDETVATATPALTFTSQDWSTEQTVTVTVNGVNDNVVTGDRSTQITCSVTAGEGESADQDYDGLSVAPTPVTVTNDDYVTVTLSPPTVTRTNSAFSGRMIFTPGADHLLNRTEC